MLVILFAEAAAVPLYVPGHEVHPVALFRVGDDEFVLIIRDHRSDEEILRTIKQYESILSSRLTVNGSDLYITASFGYALFPKDARSSDSLFSYANAAMNEVKRLGSSEHILHFTSELFSR